MQTGIFLHKYIAWYVTDGFRDIMMFWENLLWFGYHFFSIELLAKTFFRPIYRMQDRYGAKGLDLEYIAQTFVTNTISRLVGMLLRLIIIIVGVVFELVIFILGPLLLFFWALIPLLIPVLLFSGIIFFFL